MMTGKEGPNYHVHPRADLKVQSNPTFNQIVIFTRNFDKFLILYHINPKYMLLPFLLKGRLRNI